VSARRLSRSGAPGRPGGCRRRGRWVKYLCSFARLSTGIAVWYIADLARARDPGCPSWKGTGHPASGSASNSPRVAAVIWMFISAITAAVAAPRQRQRRSGHRRCLAQRDITRAARPAEWVGLAAADPDHRLIAETSARTPWARSLSRAIGRCSSRSVRSKVRQHLRIPRSDFAPDGACRAGVRTLSYSPLPHYKPQARECRHLVIGEPLRAIEASYAR
jgi:hypothetical protein